MTADERKRLHQLGRYLREHVPLTLPVSIRFVHLRTTLGDCSVVGGRFIVRVFFDMTCAEASGVMIHEFAHALSWGMDGDNNLHGDCFKDAQSRMFAVYENWLRGE